jgi:hypothetical protein
VKNKNSAIRMLRGVKCFGKQKGERVKRQKGKESEES